MAGASFYQDGAGSVYAEDAAGTILAKLKTEDGTGSGLDADLLDGQSGAYYLSYANLTGKPTAVSAFSNDAGYLTGITSGQVTTALGFTPYNATNPSGYISSITSGNVTTALGYTPANKAGDTFTGAVTLANGSTITGAGSNVSMYLTNTGTGGGSFRFILGQTADALPGGLGLFDNTAGAYRIAVNSSGEVGIGTSSPISGAGLTVGNDANGSALVKHSFSTSATERAFISMLGATGEMRYSAGFSGYGGFSTFYTVGAERMRIDSSGNVGIGTPAPSALLDINADKFRVRTSKTPATASATGNTGDICWDANYIYVCTASNTWKRAALTTW